MSFPLMPSVRQAWNVPVIVFTAGLLTSCAASTSTNQTKTVPTASPAVLASGAKVVATNTVLCDVAKQIAANTINLTCLIKPGADPHVYQPTPEDRKAIEKAQLILYGGYNFEPSIIKLINATSNPAPKVAVDEIAVPTPQQFEEDGKIEPDPHVWHNARNGIRIVETVETNLAKIAPNHAALYAKNAKAIATELSQIDTWIKAQISTIPKSSRTLVTTHDALGYYSNAYGIPVAALEGVSTEEKPTAANVKALVTTIKAARVPTIFAELSINPKLIETVARETNVVVSGQEIYADGLGETGNQGDTYQKMLVANTKAIVEGLGGKYVAFQPK